MQLCLKPDDSLVGVKVGWDLVEEGREWIEVAGCEIEI